MKREHLLIVVLLLVGGGYLFYRWYENNQANQFGTSQGGAGLGSNLNSVAPELVGGSTGPSIGPALSAPVTINITGGSDSSSTYPMANPAPVTPGTPEENQATAMQAVTGSSTNALLNANPENSSTGIQQAAPVSAEGGQAAASSAAGSKAGTATVTHRSQVHKAAPRPATHKPQAKPLKRPGTPKESNRKR